MDQNACLNDRYGRFIVTRYDADSMRSVQCGAEHPTIESALAYAARNERRSRHMLMVDLPLDLRRKD